MSSSERNPSESTHKPILILGPVEAALATQEALAIAASWLRAVELGVAVPGPKLSHAQRILEAAERLAGTQLDLAMRAAAGSVNRG